MTCPRIARVALGVLTLTAVAFAQDAPHQSNANQAREAPRENRPMKVQASEHVATHCTVVAVRDAEAVSELLAPVTRLYEQPFVLVPDIRGKRIILATHNADELKLAMDLIAQLDTPPSDEQADETSSVSLRFAHANEVVGQLYGLYKHERDLRIVADERANTVWLSAPPNVLSNAVETARKMDEVAGDAAAAEANTDVNPVMRIYVLKYANPWEVMNAATALTPSKFRSARLAVTDGEKIVVLGSDDAQAWFSDLFAKVDTEPQREQQSRNRPMPTRRTPRTDNDK